jgi:hypothetical protein
MNLFKRGMIFVTFFGSCLGIALLVAALGTKFWIVARARRDSNPEESDGRIHFGLFEGKKELNVAYGWRTYDINGEFNANTSFKQQTKLKTNLVAFSPQAKYTD